MTNARIKHEAYEEGYKAAMNLVEHDLASLRSRNEQLLDILKRVEHLSIWLEGNDNALHFLIQQALKENKGE